MLEIELLIAFFIGLGLSFLSLKMRGFSSKEAKSFSIIVVTIITLIAYIYLKFFHKSKF